MFRVYTAAFAVAATLLLNGCANNGDSPGISYAKSVEKLGILPVYPPREDIQVGDIYGHEINAGVEPVKQRTVYLTTHDMTPQILTYLKSRYKFGLTTGDTSATIAGKSVLLPNQRDAMEDAKVMDKGIDLTTLPIDGFPDITVDTGISVGLQGAAGDLGAAFGFQAAQTHHMNLHFEDVTSYGVSIPTALDVLDKFCQQSALNPPRQNYCNEDLITNALTLKFALPSGAIRHADPLMVSKVYLARKITFSFEDAALAAAAAALATKQGTPAPTIDITAVNTAVANKDSLSLTQLAAIQTALNASVTTNTNANGVTFSIAGYSKNTVSFDEVFERPVVVGYEAVMEYSDLYTPRRG